MHSAIQLRFTGLLLGLICLLGGQGCGSSQRGVPVQGKVTVKGGGPLPQGSVHFVSDKITSSSELRPDGSYTLTAFGVSNGIPPGSYRVFLTGTAQGDYRSPKPLIDARYNSLEKSDLTAEVSENAGAKTLDFELDPPQ